MGVRSTLQPLKKNFPDTKKPVHMMANVTILKPILHMFDNFRQNRVPKLKRGEIKECNALI